MEEPPIPMDVLELIVTHIDSVAELEALLLLSRDPEARWDAEKMARRLYTSEKESMNILSHLSEHGFLRRFEDGYSYGCLRKDLHESAGKLAKVHARHLIQLTKIIHGKSSHARQFAEAFRLRKDR